jgi:hypothetical protein
MGLQNAEVIARALKDPFAWHKGSNFRYTPVFLDTSEWSDTNNFFVKLGALVSYETTVAVLVANTYANKMELWVCKQHYSPTTDRQLMRTRQTWRNTSFHHDMVSARVGRPMTTSPEPFYVDDLRDRTWPDGDVDRHIVVVLTACCKSTTKGAEYLRKAAAYIHGLIHNATFDVPDTPRPEIDDLCILEQSLLLVAQQADLQGNFMARAFAQGYIALNADSK